MVRKWDDYGGEVMQIKASITHMLMLMTILAVLPLMVNGCTLAAPDETATDPNANLRQARGEIYLPAIPEWGGVSISMDLSVTEVDPETHAARGHVNWCNIVPNAEPGAPTWKCVKSEARYIFFGEDIARGEMDAVAVISQIGSKEGWGEGEAGQYAYFWLRDGGEANPDQWGMRYYSLDPFQEFYPQASPPIEGGYFTIAEMQADDPVLPVDVELGDLALFRPLPLPVGGGEGQ